jgi:hypothetical protein
MSRVSAKSATILVLLLAGLTAGCSKTTDTDTNTNTAEYTYGALFEPPAGQILHSIGQWQEGNANYLAALDRAGASALQPASELSFIALGLETDSARDWDWQLYALDSALQDGSFDGRIPSLSLHLRGEHLRGEEYIEG